MLMNADGEVESVPRPGDLDSRESKTSNNDAAGGGDVVAPTGDEDEVATEQGSTDRNAVAPPRQKDEISSLRGLVEYGYAQAGKQVLIKASTMRPSSLTRARSGSPIWSCGS